MSSYPGRRRDAPGVKQFLTHSDAAPPMESDYTDLCKRFSSFPYFGFEFVLWFKAAISNERIRNPNLGTRCGA